jgi:hypothetical protein
MLLCKIVLGPYGVRNTSSLHGLPSSAKMALWSSLHATVVQLACSSIALLLLNSHAINTMAMRREAHLSASAPCPHREIVEHDLGRSATEIAAVVAAVDGVEDHRAIISNRAIDGAESDHELTAH